MAELFAHASETRDQTAEECEAFLDVVGGHDAMRRAGVVCFTDGSASTKTRLGGWGAVLLFGDQIKELWGGWDETTNNAMELTGIQRAVAGISGRRAIVIHSDSEYCVNALKFWHFAWRRNDWMTAGGTPVKNAELIEAITQSPAWDRVALSWIKGHANHFFNERADELAGRYKPVREVVE